VAGIVVREHRTIADVDPAVVWALVADPAKIDEWSGAHLVGYMGRELPAVGSAFFATWRAGAPEQRAVRFEFTEWVAGNSFRCAMSPGRLGRDRHVQVAVESVLDPGGAHSHVEIVHVAEVPAWAAAFYRFLATRRVRSAIERLVRRVHSE
jgi:hypothetical protein